MIVVHENKKSQIGVHLRISLRIVTFSMHSPAKDDGHRGGKRLSASANASLCGYAYDIACRTLVTSLREGGEQGALLGVLNNRGASCVTDYPITVQYSTETWCANFTCRNIVPATDDGAKQNGTCLIHCYH